MDEMKVKLSTKLMRGLVSKLISKMVRDKLGYDVYFNLNELELKTIDGNVTLHIGADATISNDEFMKIIKNVNLG